MAENEGGGDMNKELSGPKSPIDRSSPEAWPPLADAQRSRSPSSNYAYAQVSHSFRLFQYSPYVSEFLFK